MLPHIIFLLLIASSPFSALGDEPASWGSLSAGPSESECRPYIEKALQGASIQDSPSDPGDPTDVGGIGLEQATPLSEVSEAESSEVPSDGEGVERLNENESLEIDNNELKDESVLETESGEKSGEEAPLPSDKEENSSETEAEELSAEESSPAEGASDEEETESRPEASREEEAGMSEAENGTESAHIPSTDEASDETKADTQEEPAETNDLPIEDSILQTDPTSNETGESQEENLGGAVESTAEVLESLEDVSEQAASAEEAASDESVKVESVNEESEESGTAEGGSGEEEVSGEEQGAEDTNGSGEDEGSGEEVEPQPSAEVVDEPTGEESEETVDNNEILDDTSKETEKSSETADESDEKIEEATDKSTEEPGDIHSEENIVEQEQSQKEDENLNAHENGAEGVEESEETPASLEEGTIDEDAASSTEEDEKSSIGESSEEPEQAQVEAVSEEAEVEVAEAREAETSEVTDSEVPSAETQGGENVEPPTPEEELSVAIEIPEKLRSREHMPQILRLNSENEESEKLLAKTVEHTLRELKKLYDIAIKPLEILYKYRDLSNRHFGDPEIFSKPLILFMGPWSGGKSTIINYLLENEYKNTALRTGAEPSPAYFNIVMWGEHEEVLDGTQLAADWTFSGLQKFGQGLLDRLRGLRLNHPLLEKVNIVEIPGILEIRKQVERLFPFNDACQWFIDRADIIFLIYDPSKLDVGPETEAILDQLKGREMQTRIILNKADQVKPEELMRVQGTLIWNISPLMSSTEPPIMYSTSLWSIPYESGAPARLLHAQERAFLKDLRDAIDRRVENKIASARRFAVRVRNHAKMVDCYLTTYYNHKSFFGNKKKISDDIIEHPQNYHIYEGLSTLTNISRYDLPDPDVYRDFFRLNPVYEFQQLSSTCTYFRGCPINRLDVAIAYDLPELVGKYKKQVEEVISSAKK